MQATHTHIHTGHQCQKHLPKSVSKMPRVHIYAEQRAEYVSCCLFSSVAKDTQRPKPWSAGQNCREMKMEAKSQWDGGFSLMCCLLTTEPVTSATGKSVPLQLIVIALKQQLLAGRHRQGAPGSWRYTHFGRSLSANDWYNLISEFQMCVLHLDSQMHTYPWPVGSIFGVWTSWHLSNRKAWLSKQPVFWKLALCLSFLIVVDSSKKTA